MSDLAALLPLTQKYVEKDPLTAARTLETLGPAKASATIDALPPGVAARILPLLQVSYAAQVLALLQPSQLNELVKRMDARRAATVFMHLPDETRDRFVPHLPDKVKWQVQELLTYPEGSVGRIMVGAFHLPRNLSVRVAITKIRDAASRVPTSYVYVVDDDEILLGVLSMHELLVANRTVTLEEIMSKDVFSVHCFVAVEETASELARRGYFAAPVVDGEGRLLGAVKAEHMIKGARDEIAQDLQVFFGAGRDEKPFSPVAFSLKKRIPWLQVNLLTAFLAASVIALFEDTIAQLTVLAVFLPVVAGQGGNAGAQALAIVMRGLVMREVRARDYTRLILKEGRLGLINGLLTGFVTGVVAWIYQDNIMLGVVVGLGMIVNLCAAGLAGAAIPLTMKKVGLDPAQSASIILTTVTDVVGFFAFLGFAVLFKDALLSG